MNVRRELAAAAHAAAEARARVPAPYRPWRPDFGEVKAKVERHAAEGRPERARAVIDEWRDSYLAQCAQALLNAPLGP